MSFIPVNAVRHLAKTRCREAKRSLSNLYWRPAVRLAGLPPVPPRSLLVHVMAQNNVKLFMKSGESICLQMEQALRKYLDTSFHHYSEILDFGVGCGRIERWLDPDVQARITGVDVSRELIEFCRGNLKGRYSLIRPEPDLPFEDGRFSLVISFSVFSHMERDDAAAWIDELHRVTSEGAVLLITTHMEWCAETLLAEEALATYRDEGLCIVQYGAEGDHHDRYVSAFYSREAWRSLWDEKFELVGQGYGRDPDEFASVSDGEKRRPALPMGQALSVFRRR